MYSKPSSAKNPLTLARYSGFFNRWLAWLITPWQVLQMVNIGRSRASAIAKVRAFRVSPNNSFFSCRTPAPVQDAAGIS